MGCIPPDHLSRTPDGDEVDDDLLAFVQRLFGYAITGDPRERILPIFWGGGRNGKSTLLETVSAALGSGYAGTIGPSTPLHKA